MGVEVSGKEHELEKNQTKQPDVNGPAEGWGQKPPHHGLQDEKKKGPEKDQPGQGEVGQVFSTGDGMNVRRIHFSKVPMATEVIVDIDIDL